jgi:predicted amidohydrolase
VKSNSTSARSRPQSATPGPTLSFCPKCASPATCSRPAPNSRSSPNRSPTAEQDGRCIYNSAVLVTHSGGVHVYRKSHLFLDEKDIFDRGDTPFPVFRLDGVGIGMLVCFDYIFPESGRALALNGAQVICHPSNLVLDYAQWMTLTRAAENRVFWIVANRTGSETTGEKALSFTGRSQVVAPTGKLLYRAGMDTEELPVIDIDPRDAFDKMATPRNHLLEDRRTDLYPR